MSRIQQWGCAVALLGAGAVAGLTLYPQPQASAAAARTPLTCLACGELGGVDVVLNLLLFIPLGLGLRLAGWPWHRLLGAAAGLSLAVELLQLTLIPGRDASLGDLVNNTVGGALGGALGARLHGLLAPSPRAAFHLFAGGAAGWLALMGFSAWLQQPGLPAGPITSVWAGATADPSAFGGRVVAVELNGTPMPARGTPPDERELRAAVASGQTELRVRIESGPEGRFREWIYSLRVSDVPELMLAQDGRELALTVPARSRWLRFRSPTLQMSDALPAGPGVPVLIAGGMRNNRLWLTSTRDDGSQRRTLALSPAHGWSLVSPFGIPLGPGVRLLTGLWIGALLLPLGFWAARAGGRPGNAALLALTLLLGLGAIPTWFGYAPVHWSEWLAGALGAGGGWALGRRAAYLQLRCGSPSISESSSS